MTLPPSLPPPFPAAAATRALLPALLLACLLPLTGCKPASKAPPPPPANVTVAKPVEREVMEWDEYTGRLAAVEQVDVRAQVSGYLASIYFTDGQVIEKGDLLFVIDPRPLQATLDRAEAGLKQAEAALSLADANLKRSQELRDTKAISAQEFAERRSEQLNAAASVAAARAEARAAQLNLDFTRVTAPVGGRTGRHLVTEASSRSARSWT